MVVGSIKIKQSSSSTGHLIDKLEVYKMYKAFTELIISNEDAIVKRHLCIAIHGLSQITVKYKILISESR